jgi:hypothetical protein
MEVVLGLSYYLQEELTDAARFLERAIEIRPPATSLLNAQGDIYVGLDRSTRQTFSTPAGAAASGFANSTAIASEGFATCCGESGECGWSSICTEWSVLAVG